MFLRGGAARGGGCGAWAARLRAETPSVQRRARAKKRAASTAAGEKDVPRVRRERYCVVGIGRGRGRAGAKRAAQVSERCGERERG